MAVAPSIARLLVVAVAVLQQVIIIVNYYRAMTMTISKSKIV